MQISTIGIDIGKNSFHFVGFDARGGIVIRRQCSRTQLVRALANVPPCLVGMEACSGAHHLGRILIAQARCLVARSQPSYCQVGRPNDNRCGRRSDDSPCVQG